MSEFNEKMALAMIEELPIGDNAKKVLTDIVKTCRKQDADIKRWHRVVCRMGEEIDRLKAELDG